METRDLFKLRNWVNWERGTKAPLSPFGGYAKVNDPSTWGTYDDACRTSELVGFVLPQDRSVTVLDLDGAISNGKVIARYRKLLSLVDWCEVSPSGTGLHVLVSGSKPDGMRSRYDFAESRMEVYDHGRFITYTGDMLPDMGGTIVDGSAVFAGIMELQHATAPKRSNARAYKAPKRKTTARERWEKHKALIRFHAEIREALEKL